MKVEPGKSGVLSRNAGIGTAFIHPAALPGLFQK